MDESVVIEMIVQKLSNGEQFGMFGQDTKVYFRDGTKVRYKILWKAVPIFLKIKDNLSGKTLLELLPDLFIGTYGYPYTKHKWNKLTRDN